jgi:Icc-related predicted phosphoesterase
MLRIAVIGDLHADRERLDAALELLADRRSDLCLLVGDLGLDPPWTSPARYEQRAEHDRSVRGVLRRVREGLDCPLLFVPGNHDLADPPWGLDGLNVDGRVAEVSGLRVVGLGGSGPSRFGFPYEWTEEEAGRILAALFPHPPERAIDVFLSHSPPAGTTLDRTHRGEHVGSRTVREWLARIGPRLFVCGHIHEAWGVEEVDGVPCLNAGGLGEPYGRVIACRIEWEEGPRRIEILRPA